ncbi:MAG: ComEA family DNA-binding protein [bacterium]
MKFTRLQLILLGSGLLVTSLALWTLVTNQEANLVETASSHLKKISANYTYTPIVKKEAVKDIYGNEIVLFSASGFIKVNINSSNIDELVRLPGVGPATALRILEYRQAHGPFKEASDLLKIKGIGPKTFARISDQVFIGKPDPLTAEQIETLKTAREEKKKSEKTVTLKAGPCGPGRVNINTASLEELQTLPRVGPKIAQRILDDRAANGPFKDATDLIRVKGIGPKTLERMIEKICAE